MSNIEQTISNFKLFSNKDNHSSEQFHAHAKKPTVASYLATVAIVFIIGWGVYKYRHMVTSLYQKIIETIRLSAYLTKKGEVSTVQPSVSSATSTKLTLDSVAHSLGIVTAPKETA